MAVPYYSDDYSFVVLSVVREHDLSSSTFISQDHFGYLWSFVVLCKLQTFLSSIKNATGNLIGIALNLYIALGNIVI